MEVPRRSGTDRFGLGPREPAWPVAGEGRGKPEQFAAVIAATVGIIYGKQVQDRDGEASGEVLDPEGAAVHALWASPRGVSQVRAVPDLFPEARRSGLHSGGEEGELVR